jgi:L-amino acid N-acyltransferase YncA
MELTIRDAKPDDAAGIVAIFNPIIHTHAHRIHRGGVVWCHRMAKLLTPDHQADESKG